MNELTQLWRFKLLQQSQKINSISIQYIWTQNKRFVTGSPTGPTEEENSYDYEEEEEAPGETRWDSFLFSSAFYSGLISPLKIVLLVEIFSCAPSQKSQGKIVPTKILLPSEAQVVQRNRLCCRTPSLWRRSRTSSSTRETTSGLCHQYWTPTTPSNRQNHPCSLG